MNPELLRLALLYVTDAPFFWGSMGFTSAIAMFTGVLLYDGHLNQIRKGLVSVLSYASMVFWITTSRVLTPEHIQFLKTQSVHPEYAFAGLISLISITFSWIFGIVLGVLIFRVKYKGKSVD